MILAIYKDGWVQEMPEMPETLATSVVKRGAILCLINRESLQVLRKKGKGDWEDIELLVPKKKEEGTGDEN